MSILIKSATAITAALAIAYGAGNFITKSLYSEITIDAPAKAVWHTLTEQEAITEWNPFIKKLEGELKVGERLSVTIQSKGNRPMDFAPKVLVSNEGRELRWIGQLGIKGIFDGEHYFILEEKADGKTLFRHGENFSGMLAWILLPLIDKDTLGGFEAMNEALKDRVERAI